MNPLTNVKNIQKLNERMLDMGVADETSWHKQYKDSAYVFIGGLPYDLSEGDILCVFSQYGEIVNVNLVRDKATGKQKGFCFLCYEDQRSTILAVDNFNGTKLGGRTIRVDHCANYRRPKGDEKDDDGNRKDIMEEGCAPQIPSPSPSEDELSEPVKKKTKKVKKHKKDKESESRSHNNDSSGSESEDKDKKTKRHYTTNDQHKTQTYRNQDLSEHKSHASRERNHHNHTKTTSTREWDNGKQPDERKQPFDIKKEVTDKHEYSSREKHSRNNRRENEGSSYGGTQRGNTDHSRDRNYVTQRAENTDHKRVDRDYHNYERETSKKYHERDSNEKRGYKK